MWRQDFWKILLLFVLSVELSVQVKKQKSSVVSDIDDVKEFKKLLRTKTNVLVLFINNAKSSQSTADVFREAADNVRGHATLVVIDCNGSDAKKLCKKFKVSDKPFYLKHYKDGEFHKDYDRGLTVSAMTNFLRDPTGDLPWDEDPSAADIFHLADGPALTKFLKKGAATGKNAMVMFYAPWCGYCKSMKPDYVGAAGDLKGEAQLAAIDVSKSGNSFIRKVYNITGFPTLLYFEKGQLSFPYNGDNKRDAIVKFMRDPTQQPESKPKEEESWSPDTDVVHLTADTFDSVLTKAEHALVVFYAPWCGHCKRIKPEFEKAATKIKNEKINGVLAAVDATKEPNLAARFGVKGYPTLKYFSKGEFQYDAGHARQEDQIVSFIKSPSEPPPPPPPEKPWAEEESPVRHLDSATFKPTLRKIKHAIVMFYAPWCGHCKSTKPEFTRAAERFADELMVAFVAVDCTQHQDVCGRYGVKGYPTIKYLSHHDKVVQEYSGGRKEADFVSFINAQMGKGGGSHDKKRQETGFNEHVTLADDGDFDQVIASTKPTFVMFYATWCSHCAKVKKIFNELATKLATSKHTVRAAAVDASDSEKVADRESIKSLPTFKLYASGKHVADYDAERTVDVMYAFCDQHAKVKDEL